MVRLSKDVPKDLKQRYVEIFNKYIDIFAWSYEDLKTYDTSIIQHKIPLKPWIKPYK